MIVRDEILTWYHKNKRNLPWRSTTDPYKIWVSEIILQQTRIRQGLPYYLKFIEKFPDVNTLALATEQSVLNVWKGLGYYSRARNMHHTAMIIMETSGGVFPKDYSSLVKLKGIGKYTAAAISSICNNEIVPAIDGNVTRLISRYFGIQESVDSSIMVKKVRWISEQLIPDQNPGDYNQAMMEYGAIICKPMSPNCTVCTLSQTCFAFGNQMVEIIPGKKKVINKKHRFLNYLHFVTSDGRIIMSQRKATDIWKNLWELPLIESVALLNTEEVVRRAINVCFKEDNFDNYPISVNCTSFEDREHILTHQVLHVRFFTIRIECADENLLILKENYIFCSPHDNNLPVPRVIENFLRKN